MALPFVMACDHLDPSIHNARNLVGAGAMLAVGDSDLVLDSELGRVVVSGTGSSAIPFSIPVTPHTDKIVFGFRVKTINFGSAATILRLASFISVSGEMLWFGRTAGGSGTIGLQRGSVNLYNAGSSFFNSWIYWEFAIHFHQSNGKIIIRQNGVEVFSFEGNTSNVSVDSGVVSINGEQPSSSRAHVTDWYVKEWANPDSSDSPFWGPIAPLWRPVASDVSNDGWVASDAGDIHDALQNDNAKYARPGASDDTVEMGLEPIPDGTTFVLGQVSVAVSTAPAGGGTIGLDFKDGVNVTDGNPNGRVIGDQLALTTQAVFHVAAPGNVPWTPELADDANLLLTAVVS